MTKIADAGRMKQIAGGWSLEELLQKIERSEDDNKMTVIREIMTEASPATCNDQNAAFLGVDRHACCSELSFALVDAVNALSKLNEKAVCSSFPPCAFPTGDDQQDALSSYSNSGAFSNIWPHSITSVNSVSPTVGSQSSACAGSPTSHYKPGSGESGAGVTGDSSREQSDEGELEIVGPGEQSVHVAELRRLRRKESNRESARRSRKKKQAHLAELECQVDQLSGEYAGLYKQLTQANQQFDEAATLNRVLRADVEALRTKVRAAETILSRGCGECYNLNSLIQCLAAATELPAVDNFSDNSAAVSELMSRTARPAAAPCVPVTTMGSSTGHSPPCHGGLQGSQVQSSHSIIQH